MTNKDAIKCIEDVLSSDYHYDESLGYQLTSDDFEWLEKAKKALEKQIPPNAQKSSHWISVKKDLPQNGLARVLVFLENAEITESIGFPKIDTDRYIDGKWVRWSSYVTHWMPLPNTAHQIPKGEHE